MEEQIIKKYRTPLFSRFKLSEFITLYNLPKKPIKLLIYVQNNWFLPMQKYILELNYKNITEIKLLLHTTQNFFLKVDDAYETEKFVYIKCSG